jgi:hypothetical protein
VPNIPTKSCGLGYVGESNSVNTESSLPNISDVMTRKGRNVIGIDMIRNNRIGKRDNTLVLII